MKSLFFTFLFLCIPLFVFCQIETSNWYFGEGAGIQFNNDGSVTALTNGRLNTLEGCTSISDSFGDLVFYTDGITVFDRNHNIMENGTGLYGDPSSTQSAIIVPKPEDPNIYYIFTVDTAVFENDFDFGLNYSTVDIRLNNGNGSVIQKNINLLKDCSEKISAVIKDCSDQSIWLVTLASADGISPIFNTYHAFEVNTTGVITNSIKNTFTTLNIEDPRGYLKFSPDGNKMASANMSAGLFMYDFDSLTGVLTNQTKINISDENKNAYGIEFSTNGNYFYTHTSNNESAREVTGHKSSLLQYSLIETNIASTEKVLHKSNNYRGALQLGLNGKIYRTISTNYTQGTSFLGVINEPNMKGDLANYKHNAISLNGKNSAQGLPPFIQSFFSTVDIIINSDNETSGSLTICEGDSFGFSTEDFSGATYAWTKDGIPFNNPDRNTYKIDTSQKIDEGRYHVEITLADSRKCKIIGEGLLSINTLPDASNLELIQCDVNTINTKDGITSFNINQISLKLEFSYVFYETLQDSYDDKPILNLENFTNTTPYNQTIYYRITNTSNCSEIGELRLITKDVDLSSNTYTFYQCDMDPNDNILEGTFDITTLKENNFPNQQIIFYKNFEDVSLEKNPLDNSFTTSPTSIYGRIENSNQCEDIIEVELKINPTPVFTLEESYLICLNNPILNIDGPAGFDTYKWIKKDGATETTISSTKNTSITETGYYSLEVGYLYNQNNQEITCTTKKSFKVLPSNIAKIESLTINDISENNTVLIEVSGEGDYEYALENEFSSLQNEDFHTYQDSPIFEGVLAGIYKLYVKDKNGCGITDNKISVIGYQKFFTPNSDSYNDLWNIKGVNDQFQRNSNVYIFNRYGNLLIQLPPNSKGWDGTINGKPMPASDYWFKVNLEDGRIFKGHFALKR